MSLERRKVYYRTAALTAIIVIHGALILTLIHHRSNFDRISKVRNAPALEVSNIPRLAPEIRLDPPSSTVATVTTSVAKPEVMIEPESDALSTAAGGSSDPFAGAGLPMSTSLTSAERLPREEAFFRYVAEAWTVVSSHGEGNGLASGIVIELLCQPAGGFTEARMRGGTGSKEVDSALISLALRHQALVPSRFCADRAMASAARGNPR